MATPGEIFAKPKTRHRDRCARITYEDKSVAGSLLIANTLKECGRILYVT